MSQREEGLPALGQPAGEPLPEGDGDFAGEHDATAVDDEVIAGRGADAEAESPRGWSGLDSDGPP